jgi:ribosomal protein L7/L12
MMKFITPDQVELFKSTRYKVLTAISGGVCWFYIFGWKGLVFWVCFLAVIKLYVLFRFRSLRKKGIFPQKGKETMSDVLRLYSQGKKHLACVCYRKLTRSDVKQVNTFFEEFPKIEQETNEPSLCKEPGGYPEKGKEKIEDVKRLLKEGNKTLAIRCYRAITELGLSEAKRHLEQIQLSFEK